MALSCRENKKKSRNLVCAESGCIWLMELHVCVGLRVSVCVCVAATFVHARSGWHRADEGLASRVGQANYYSNGLSVRCK